MKHGMDMAIFHTIYVIATMVSMHCIIIQVLMLIQSIGTMVVIKFIS